MKMKTNAILLGVAFAMGLFFSSCEDEEVIPKPVIGEVELGVANSHVAYIGSDLHIDVEVVAEGKIDVITVEIHKEDGSGEEIEVEFTDYSGQKNGTFHEHVDIPSGMAAGEYHFHLTVTDQVGNATTIEEELTLEESTDTESPEISISEAPAENEEFSTGQSISISGQVTDNVGIGGIVVALVREGGSQEPDDVIIMQLEYFQDTDEVDFSAAIEAGASQDNQETPEEIEGDNAWQSGGYYILVRAWDTIGNIKESQQYPIKISL